MKATTKMKHLHMPDITKTYDITSCFLLIKQLFALAEFVTDNNKAHPSAFYETTKSMAQNIMQIKKAVLGEEDPPGSTISHARLTREEAKRADEVAALESQMRFLDNDNVELRKKLAEARADTGEGKLEVEIKELREELRIVTECVSPGPGPGCPVCGCRTLTLECRGGKDQRGGLPVGVICHKCGVTGPTRHTTLTNGTGEAWEAFWEDIRKKYQAREREKKFEEKFEEKMEELRKKLEADFKLADIAKKKNIEPDDPFGALEDQCLIPLLKLLKRLAKEGAGNM